MSAPASSRYARFALPIIVAGIALANVLRDPAHAGDALPILRSWLGLAVVFLAVTATVAAICAIVMEKRRGGRADA